MKRSRWMRHLAALAALALVVAACNGDDVTDDDVDVEAPDDEEDEAIEDEEPEDEETEEEPEAVDAPGLVIGYILPESGPLAFLGPPQIQGVELALEDINAAGGVLGEEVTLLSGDEAGDEAVARETAERLIAEGVHAVVGAAASGMSLAFIDALHDNEIVQCSASNTSPAFSDHESNAFYFRTAPPDDGQGPIMAELVIGDGHASAAVMARADDYGQNLLSLTAENLEAQGAEVTAEVVYDPEAATFDAEVGEAIADNPDAVIVIGFDEGAQVLAGLIEAGYTPEQLYGADGMKSDDLAELVDPDNPNVLDGMQGTAPSAALEFNERLIERLPDTNAIYGGQAYDCTVVIALAAEAAGSTDPSEFRDFMVEVVGDGTTCTSFEECRDLLEAGEEIDYDGASGGIGWTGPGADPASVTYEVWVIDDGGTTSQVSAQDVEL
jgi:ABC-type branched-subunit amino acid transport system substrate-binding protein